MSGITISEMNVFPLKSAAGLSVQTARVTERGFLYDRRWMLTDTEYRFLSQRKIPRMALIQVEFSDNCLRFNAPGQKELEIFLNDCSDQKVSVQIWSDNCLANSCGCEADSWFSQFLEMPVHLVYMPDSAGRLTDPFYGSKQSPVSFADGYPFLLISEASLQDLNNRLPRPVAMKRFRANLVIKGCDPYAEDSWKRIQIGDVEFELVKPCSRCTITTVDPETAKTGKEPLKTLATYRKKGSKVYFGQNLIHRNTGLLHLGMPVAILQ